MKLSNLTDRQILIHLVHRVCGVEKRLDNHLNHMFKLAITLVGIVGSLIVALIIILLA
ncbi:hypothetical protein LCGC14_1723520 [marine sediment metagenome]|uniref:Uncharacterized protein n=1 Tax=marine sediment metagenome TaxID=412755 RepID=A0A0F9JS81_9ZZZZ